MKGDAVYKRAFNATVDLFSSAEPGPLPSENKLRGDLGVSRTTVRKILRELTERGLVAEAGGLRFLTRALAPSDRYSGAETVSRLQHVEQQFMEWMLRGGATPGTPINELDLARQFGVATTGIREFLIRFSRFGLIEKRSNAGWLFRGFTREFALDLFEIRVMFELRSARLFAALPESSPLWARLDAVERDHLQLRDSIEARFHDFSALDDRFHRLVAESAPNRFVSDFSDVFTFIFHYHYQWNKADEKARNEAALSEHLAYIDALRSRDVRRVDRACRAHLRSARNTLMRSIGAGM
jgi:DNA-binding GntR family transcriptional regulator